MERILSGTKKKSVEDAVITKKLEKKYRLYCYECNRSYGTNCSRSKYCSKTCKHRSEARERTRKYSEDECQWCGNKFTSRDDANTKHCSKACGVLMDLESKTRTRDEKGRYKNDSV